MPEVPTHVCFVTGTRAEFGLMRTTLDAIGAHPKLRLSIVATGMHTDPSRGRTADEVGAARIVPWTATSDTPSQHAIATGDAIAGLVRVYDELKVDVVLVVGDRYEALAAATAGHLSGRIVAHVHGGDRAQGQADDAIRHAVTKLAHVHFAATPASARRIARLGEDAWRIHTVGAPGIDGIERQAASRKLLADAGLALPRQRYALLVLHPTDADDAAEERRANVLLDAVESTGFERVVVIQPNTDPGAAGIVRCWTARAAGRHVLLANATRPLFLGLLRDAAVLVGNSSSGVIEAASFGTPVLDIGPRQLGRERAKSVRHVDWDAKAIRGALRRIWRGGDPVRTTDRNSYGGLGTGRRIAGVLASLRRDDRLRRKLIAY
jgi:UDP-hydrolysing UDP-N-acetyl-D-glucosamine 2-epimerase